MINAALAACSQFVVSSAACAAKVAFNHLLSVWFGFNFLCGGF